MAKEITLDDLMNPKFQVKQAKYENARTSVLNAYRIAADLARHRGYSSLEDYFRVVDSIKERFHKDLDNTLSTLEQEETNGVHKAKSSTVPKPT